MRLLAKPSIAHLKTRPRAWPGLFLFRILLLVTVTDWVSGCANHDYNASLSSTERNDYPFVITLEGDTKERGVSVHTLEPYVARYHVVLFLFVKKDRGQLDGTEYFLSTTRDPLFWRSDPRLRGTLLIREHAIKVEWEVPAHDDIAGAWAPFPLNGEYKLSRVQDLVR